MGAIAKQENVNLTFYDDAISDYKVREKQMVTEFVSGIIDLGKILLGYREDLKRTGRWIEFCGEIGISIAKANDQIRFYEASQTKLKEVKKAIIGEMINNWKRMQLFLALNDKQQDELILKTEEGEVTGDLSNDEFKNIIKEIKPAPEKVLEYDADRIVTDMLNNIEISPRADIQDIPQTAKALQTTLGIGKDTKNSLEGILHIIKGCQLLGKYLPDISEVHDAEVVAALLSDTVDEVKGFK